MQPRTINGLNTRRSFCHDFWDLVHLIARNWDLNREGARQGTPKRKGVKILTKGTGRAVARISITTIELTGMLAGLVYAFDVTERKRRREGYNF